MRTATLSADWWSLDPATRAKEMTMATDKEKDSEPAGGSAKGAVDEPAIEAVDYLGHTKYTCTLCERQNFHRLNDRAAVEAHIEDSH